jgi:hypothetical protein
MTEPEKTSNNAKPLYALPIIAMLAMLFLIYMRTGTNSYHFTPEPPRPKITNIPLSDPAVLAFKKFAEENKADWYIRPDSLDGTDYCAGITNTSTHTSADDFFYENVCGRTISIATSRTIEAWNNRKAGISGIGSK